MSEKKLQQLANYGQSIWLDYIDRPLLETGKLKALITDGLRGMTSNPSIFNNAIGKTTDYDSKIQQYSKEGKSLNEIYDLLTIQDIQEACDQFAGVYESTNKLDGYVSLEINPKIANNTEAQITEGKRLFEAVNRPNVMIKVPSTEAGFPVIEELIASGINVNTTLIFSLEQYQKTAEAYLNGLEKLQASGGNPSDVHSVASVFVSRIDSAVDQKLAELLLTDISDEQDDLIQEIKGNAAVANSRIVFESFEEIFNSEKFKSLEGANVQRVLWASTGTKNPSYSPTKYVTELISKPTVNTLPEKTLNTYIQNGTFEESFENNLEKAKETLSQLQELGINLNEITNQLLEKGVVSFEEAFTELFNSLEQKSKQLVEQ